MNDTLKPRFDHHHTTSSLDNGFQDARTNHVSSIADRMLFLTFIDEGIHIELAAVKVILFTKYNAMLRCMDEVTTHSTLSC